MKKAEIRRGQPQIIIIKFIGDSIEYFYYKKEEKAETIDHFLNILSKGDYLVYIAQKIGYKEIKLKIKESILKKTELLAFNVEHNTKKTTFLFVHNFFNTANLTLKQIKLKFIKLNNILPLPITHNTIINLHSYSIYVYRALYFKPEYELVKLDTKIEEEISRSIYGGRMEKFEQVPEKYYHYDINSLYPAMMLKPLPVGEPIEIIGGKGRFGFFLAKIKAPNNLRYYYLPRKTNNKIIYDKGEWIDWYFSEELKKAEELGYNIQYIKGYNFKKKEGIFKGFIDKFYELKLRGEDYSKTILNSLYGKISSNRPTERSFITDKIDLNKQFIIDGSHIIIKSELRGHNNNYLPAIKSAILSYSRTTLYELFKGRVYECRTDSVFLANTLSNKYLGKSIGKARLIGRGGEDY